MQYVSHLQSPFVGYTQAALQYLMSLRTVGYEQFDIHPIGGQFQWRQMPQWSWPLQDRGYGIDRRLAIIHHTPDIVCQNVVTVYDRVAVRVGEKMNVGLTVTETKQIPKWLAKRLSTLDALIVPTEWNKKVFVESGVTKPIHVLPHALGRYWWDRPLEPKALGDDCYVFGWAGNANGRKYPEGVLRAYLRAFPNNGKTALLLKVSSSAAFKDLFEAIVVEETGTAARLDPETGDIGIYNEIWPDEQMMWFYDQLDCVVSLHRGEGWGYSSAAGAMLGKALIHTNFSAPTEYINSDVRGVLPVSYTEAEATQFVGTIPYYQTTYGEKLKWAEPNLENAVEQMRKAAGERLSLHLAERDRIRNDYGWDTVGKLFVELIGTLEKQAG